MQNEVTVSPLVDILSTLLNKRIVMSGDKFVYLDNKNEVGQSDIDIALALQKTEKDLLEAFTIEQKFKNKMQTLTSKYTEEEQKTWQTQLEEARAYLTDSTAITPMLTEIADGADKMVLAQKIIDKADFLKIESGKLLAWRNRELAKIEA